VVTCPSGGIKKPCYLRCLLSASGVLVQIANTIGIVQKSLEYMSESAFLSICVALYYVNLYMTQQSVLYSCQMSFKRVVLHTLCKLWTSTQNSWNNYRRFQAFWAGVICKCTKKSWPNRVFFDRGSQIAALSPEANRVKNILFNVFFVEKRERDSHTKQLHCITTCFKFSCSTVVLKRASSFACVYPLPLFYEYVQARLLNTLK